MARPDRPNVVVILYDTARADAFEPWGASPGTTPALAQLASRGAAFPKAIAPSNWTMPSHASMFTGLLPRMAGLSILPDNKQENCRPVMESHLDRVLPEVLRRNGYRTAAASTNLWISPRVGFATGFDEFHELIGKRVRRMHQGGAKARAIWYAQAFLANVDDGMTMVEDQTKRWLDADERPFFWFMNLIECHSPYLPPKPYNDYGPIKRMRASEDARRYQTLQGVWRCCATGITPPADALERMRHMYSRAVTMMDDWLARLLEEFDRRKLLDDTIFIVTSDHGENLGEGGLIGHAVSLDDRLIHVPFVAAGPGVGQAPAEAWSLAHLPRLIADAIGLEDHPWDPADVGEGPAVSQYDLGWDPANPRLSIFEEWGATPEGMNRFLKPGTSATDGRHKLVRLGADELFYDLASDREEISPVAAEAFDAGVVERLRKAIADANATAWLPDVSKLGGEADALSDREREELEERMRLLGYL
jgi:arylsulfatase A-like enzyme